MANTYELIVKTVDQSTRPLKNIEKSLSTLERRSRSVNMALKGVGAALIAVVGARALRGIIEVTSSFEDLRTTLNTVTGSVQAGGRAFDFIADFATKSQFGVEQLSTAFIKLQAAGIEPTAKLLRTFTDTAAVTTDQLGSLEAMTDLLARTTGGGLGLEELNRLADRGIPVFNILKEEIGLTRQEISEFGKTAQGAKTIVDALLAGLDKRFGGATAARLQNLSTIVSNFQIATRQAIGEFGEGLSPALKEVISGLTNFINANQDVFRALGAGAGEVLRLLATGVANLADSLGLLQAGGLQNIFASLLEGLAGFISGFDTAIGGALRGIGSLTNSIIRLQQITGDPVVLGPGVDPSNMLINMKRHLDEATASQLAWEDANAGYTRAFKTNPYDEQVQSLQKVVTALQQGTYLQQVNTQSLGGNASAAANAATAIRDQAAALRESGEAAARAAELNAQFPVYEDAILRIANNQQTAADTANQLSGALAGVGNAATSAANQLSGYEQFLRSTVSNATQAANETGYAMQAQIDLRTQLEQGKISLDTYAEAMQRLNNILGLNTSSTTTNTEAVATVASTYRDATKAIEEYQLKQTNVSGAMGMLEQDFANGKLSLEQFKVGMDSMGAGMDDIQNRSIAMGLTLTESFQSAGDNLARGLARGIARGENIMDSFKNFMQSILEEILYQIIQQAFIKPLISSMTAGLSTAFSAFGMGGAGAFAGGLFGGGTGLFGLLGGFLGFANGGVVPGMPTRGDSVPILATPGEVILNKRQQAEVLQGGGEEPIQVNFNINAIDTRSGTEFILQNKKQITSVIQQAYNTRGQQGPLG